MPVMDTLFPQSPAQENRPIFPQRIEVDQTTLESLEHASDRLLRPEVLVDTVGVPGDFLPGSNQLRGGAPVGSGTPGQKLKASDRCPPRRVLVTAIGHRRWHQ